MPDFQVALYLPSRACTPSARLTSKVQQAPRFTRLSLEGLTSKVYAAQLTGCVLRVLSVSSSFLHYYSRA